MGLRQGSTSLFNGEWLDLAPPLFLLQIDLVFALVLTPSSWLFVAIAGLVPAWLVIPRVAGLHLSCPMILLLLQLKASVIGVQGRLEGRPIEHP